MENSTPSPIACVSVDGQKIRRIRRERGFTQLYVATCLAVTTDTVSRWENKQAPSIKQENAEKLAEVLDVDLLEIMQEAEVAEEPPTDAQQSGNVLKETAPRKPGTRGFRFLPLILLVAAAFWFMFSRPEKGTVTAPLISAERFLPAHTSPHLPFPVFIRVHRLQDSPVPFILRESFPGSVTVKNAVPPFTALNGKEGKWIETADKNDLLFGYPARADRNISPGDELVFSGHLYVEEQQLPIGGTTTIKVDNHHWADRNADNVIDDNEILAIYSFFKLFKKMGIDIDEIQRIWAGNGYRWDEAKGMFVVVSKEAS